jgi:hypothetical protein
MRTACCALFLATTLGGVAAEPTPAPAPILDGFTADPAIRVFGDTYYIYPTSDKPNWNTTEFAVWSSKNLVSWNKEAVILDVTKDLKWADLQAWAPDCVERNGTYYFYFCARGKIGVATAPSPVGPFKDALGRPLIEKGGKVDVYTIDPYPLIDEDGQAYLYYGNGRCQVFKLKPDMISFDGDPVTVPLKEFREGIVVFKRSGKYYFMWSIDDARSPDYRVGWGISDTPLGPVKSFGTNFIVLRQHPPAVGTAHHSVVNVPGTDRWYVAYHRHAIPGGGGYKREVCLARMEFTRDGAIIPMDPLTTPFRPGDRGEPITRTAQEAPRINLTAVNTNFVQTGGSCVLASYAIAASYFTGQPVPTYFEGYCQHFKLPYTNSLDAERKYATHFDHEWRKRSCRGYEVILDLHSNSTVKCFSEARTRFDGIFYLDSSAHRQELENLLACKEAFLNITFEVAEGSYHSITVVNSANGLLARDTNRRGLYPLPGLAKIGKLRDSVVYLKNK